MKTRDNVNVEVIISVTMAKIYESTKLASSTKSLGGQLDTKQIVAAIKALTQEAKAQVLDTMDSVIAKDDAEEAE